MLIDKRTFSKKQRKILNEKKENDFVCRLKELKENVEVYI